MKATQTKKAKTSHYSYKHDTVHQVKNYDGWVAFVCKNESMSTAELARYISEFSGYSIGHVNGIVYAIIKRKAAMENLEIKPVNTGDKTLMKWKSKAVASDKKPVAKAKAKAPALKVYSVKDINTIAGYASLVSYVDTLRSTRTKKLVEIYRRDGNVEPRVSDEDLLKLMSLVRVRMYQMKLGTITVDKHAPDYKWQVGKASVAGIDLDKVIEGNMKPSPVNDGHPSHEQDVDLGHELEASMNQAHMWITKASKILAVIKATTQK